MKNKNFVSAVIYLHNEEANIAGFLEMLVPVLNTNFEKYEIICVNDDSTDRTKEKVREFSKENPKEIITILNLSYYHGIELAMNAGVDISIGDFVYEFDSTFVDYDSDLVMKIYDKALEGFDIVSATGNSKQKLTSQLFYKSFEFLTGSAYHMSTETFRILSRRIINRVGGMNKTVPYRKFIYNNSGLKIFNIRYDIKISKSDRKRDRQEFNYRKNLAFESLILFTDVGYRLSMTMTMVMMVITVLMAIYAIAVYFVETPVAGWTTTVLFLSAVFFGIFAVLTVIVKYLSLIVNLIFKRERYSFESIEKLPK